MSDPNPLKPPSPTGLPADVRATDDGRWIAEWKEFDLVGIGDNREQAIERMVVALRDIASRSDVAARLSELAASTPRTELPIADDDAGDRIPLLGAAEFDALTAADKPVLVDFWASWCGPCKALTPILHELAERFDEQLTVVKVDVEAHPELAARLEIAGVPTLLLYRGGELQLRLVGARPLNDLVAEVEPLLV